MGSKIPESVFFGDKIPKVGHPDCYFTGRLSSLAQKNYFTEGAQDFFWPLNLPSEAR